MQLPAPPLLKTTIIQLNKDIDPDDNNYEILTNEYANKSASSLASASIYEEQPRKKRRRSSLFVDDEELARRKSETKQLHSIIEKRRRIKINREFEALKYLIPACRNTDNGSKRQPASANNGNKIDGMYKLTILKLSVEYILYLHHIIQRQHELLEQSGQDYQYDVGFSSIPLNVNQYRNIDKEFDFSELAAATPVAPSAPKFRFQPMKEIHEEDIEQNEAKGPLRARSETYTSTSRSQLPTPDVTPDIAPILSLLNKYSNDAQLQQQILRQQGQLAPEKKRMLPQEIEALNSAFLFDSARTRSGSDSTSTSPFTIPIKSLVKKATFYLPDPALSNKSPSSSPLSGSDTNAAAAKPKKMFFKSKVPSTNLVANVGGDGDDDDDGNRVHDATKALLTLRKPSIEKLLN